jgi:hypothetical protein
MSASFAAKRNFSPQHRLFFELAAVFQRIEKNAPEFFLIRTVQTAFLTEEQAAPVAGFVDAHVGVIGDQHYSRPGLHVTIVGDVVIIAVSRLNPTMKNIGEIGQPDAVGTLDKKFDVEFL